MTSPQTSTSLSAVAPLAGRALAQAAKQTARDAGSGTVKAFFDANRSTIASLLPAHFPPDRMLKLALGALRTNPKLTGASLSSLLGAVVTCAQLGLEPNTPLGHAYLIPFDKRENRGGQWVTVETQVQVVIGYKGLLDMARRSGEIESISAHEICQNDKFEFEFGLDERLTHSYKLTDQRGPVVGFYAAAKLKGGGRCFEVMSLADVNAIRDESAKKNRAKKDAQGRYIITGPWADHYVEMGRKTVLRRLVKWLPISIENLALAAVVDGGTIKQAGAVEDIPYNVIDAETGEVLEPKGDGDDAQDQPPLQLENEPSATVPMSLQGLRRQPVRRTAAEPAPTQPSAASVEPQTLLERWDAYYNMADAHGDAHAAHIMPTEPDPRALALDAAASAPTEPPPMI